MTITQNLCPRCGGDMRPVIDVHSNVFDSCLMCGYEDYSQDPPTRKSTGMVQYVRYGGTEAHLLESDITIPVHLVPHPQRAIAIGYEPECPFCSGRMRQKSLSGKRHNPLEERFVCDSGHRISLVPEPKEDRIVWI